MDHPILLQKCIETFMHEDELARLHEELTEIESCKRTSSSSDESLGSQQGDSNMCDSAKETALDIKHFIADIISTQNNDRNGGCMECHTKSAEIQSLKLRLQSYRRIYKA